jgi:hypothetical protein
MTGTVKDSAIGCQKRRTSDSSYHSATLPHALQVGCWFQIWYETPGPNIGDEALHCAFGFAVLTSTWLLIGRLSVERMSMRIVDVVTERGPVA